MSRGRAHEQKIFMKIQISIHLVLMKYKQLKLSLYSRLSANRNYLVFFFRTYQISYLFFIC
jgi:hypothetical protein